MRNLILNSRAWGRLLTAIVLVTAIPTALMAQDPVMKVEDGIVKVFGVTTDGAVDLHVISAQDEDAVFGLGVSPSFFEGNADALIMGYNGNAGVGLGFIGTRPTTGSGNINILIKNVVEAQFTSNGINLSAGNDYRVNGVALNVPDYVFEPDYELMPIGELADFVAVNRHLPGIPSQGEIQGGELGLGGFQMMLLEKVEELTLYTIEQEERLAAVREQSAQLEAINAQLEARLTAMEERLRARVD